MHPSAIYAETAVNCPAKIFADPVVDRYAAVGALSTAMDNPGWIVSLQGLVRPPHPVSLATAAICLACLSPRTRLWTDLAGDPLTLHWFAENCGTTPIAEPETADFSVVTKTSRMPDLERFVRNHDSRFRATLIVQVPVLVPASPHGFGPYDRLRSTVVRKMPVVFWQTWRQLQQRGAVVPDLVFTCDNNLAAVPGDWMIGH